MASDPPERMTGIVRSYCPIKGFGFVRPITVDGDSYRRDVFLDRATLLAEKCEVTNGAHVTFALKPESDGRPEACDLKILMEGVRQREFVADLAARDDVDMKKVFVGKIMYFDSDPNKWLPASFAKRDAGCGWISCEETRKLFGRDIWAYPSQLKGYKLGDVVRFRVKIDHWWSWPTAVELRPVDAVFLSGAPPKEEDIQRLLEEREQCRRMRNYQRADDIKDMLIHFGIEVEEKRRERRSRPPQEDDPEAPQRIQQLLEEREECRRMRDFQRADEIRDILRRDYGVYADKRNNDGQSRQSREVDASRQDMAAARPSPEGAGRSWDGYFADRKPIQSADGDEPPVQSKGIFTGEAAWLQEPSAQESTESCPQTSQAAPWTCPTCDEPNKAARAQCNNCGATRPQEVEELEEQAAAEEPIWQKYATVDGDGVWWWCRLDGDWFLESDPGEFAKYMDPGTGKSYWWKSDDKWFWV